MASDADGPRDEAIEKRAVGAKFTPDGTRLCVAIAVKTKQGAHVELVEDRFTFDGVQDIAERIAARKCEIAFVAVDGKAGGQDLVDRLVAAGMPRRAVHLMQTSEVVAAASKTVLMLDEKRLTHAPDAELDASAKNATKRKIGTDGYGFGGNSCPIEAAAAATWAVMTTKRKPGRKMRVL